MPCDMYMLYMHTYVNMRICACMCMYMYVCTCICIRICMYIYIHVCTRYVYLHTSVHIYIYMYICYIYIYICVCVCVRVPAVEFQTPKPVLPSRCLQPSGPRTLLPISSQHLVSLQEPESEPATCTCTETIYGRTVQLSWLSTDARQHHRVKLPSRTLRMLPARNRTRST